MSVKDTMIVIISALTLRDLTNAAVTWDSI